MQGIYWLLTIPHHAFVPYLPPGVAYIRGQLERGENTGYLHWQLSLVLSKKNELVSSRNYWDQNVTQSLVARLRRPIMSGKKIQELTELHLNWDDCLLKRNCQKDWDAVKSDAERGRLDDIPSDILVRYYGNIKRIHQDNLEAIGMEREIVCYWGTTGMGKSRRAWEEAGLNAYPKDPRSKFWDGYRGQEHVVFDEFRGGIDISHVLRWFDRYPVIVEVKGSSTVLKAKKIWITSNLHPNDWYPELDQETSALIRRLTIVHFVNPLI